jgi:hypothetical protein
MADLRFPFNSVILDYVDLLTRALSESERRDGYPDNPSLVSVPACVHRASPFYAGADSCGRAAR